MGETHTNCRAETGITVGLIDALISVSRVLAKRDLTAPEIAEALKDLRADDDVSTILTAETPCSTTAKRRIAPTTPSPRFKLKPSPKGEGFSPTPRN
jgi:hypothetical protein